MSLETNLAALATALGTDVKSLLAKIGNLTALDTSVKTSLVLAINALQAEVTALAAGAAGIDDSKGAGDTGFTWSADKITSELIELSNQLKTEILGSAPEALNTLQELAAALGNNENYATTIATALGNRVRFDEAQVLDNTQKATARTNIGGASQADLTALTNAVGNTDQNLVTVYETAKA